MTTIAMVVEFDEDDQEQVKINVGGFEITCFVAVCPFRIEQGKSYPIELSFVLNEKDQEIRLANDKFVSFERIGRGFSYLITGMANQQGLRIGSLHLASDGLPPLWGDFQGSYVSLKVDRIDVDFVE